MKYIVGLGNPEEKYVGTRHNVGRDIVEAFAHKFKFESFEYDKKINAMISEGEIGNGRKAEKVILILPDTYMNNSGSALKKYITSAKKAKDMVVVHDELDMGIGQIKVVFNKSDSGHRGVLSIIKTIKTREFPRIKIGISPITPKGKVKKPLGDEKVTKHVLGKFSPKDALEIKKIQKKAIDALEIVCTENYLLAMNKFN